MFKGVSRRWFVNTIGIVMVILVVFIATLAIVVQSYAYNSINNILRGRSDELLNVLSYGTAGYKTASEFSTNTRSYIENFQDKNAMDIMAINSRGKVFITSTGFAPDQNQQMPDYQEALQNPDSTGYWVGKLDTNEKVMAYTRVVRDSEENILGGIRYIVSLEKVDQQLLRIILTLVIAGCFVMLVIVLSGIYFVRSILLPVRQVTATANRISHGDFQVRTQKLKDDEIGDLCDAVNDMAAELAATETMKNDFISSVSHELRTPLTSIKGWAETLQAGAEADVAERGMQVIIKESQRLSGIVEELLDFSKLQSGRLRLLYKKADLLSELDEAVYTFTDRAKTEHKELDYVEQLSLSPVYADVNKLRQVFVNVIDNALKYTSEGGIITVSVNEAEGYLHICVADTGCGVPAEHLPNITKKFYKANQMVRGSGIGLAVAEEIVQMHAGYLRIESQENIGTAVTISLPTCKYLQENPQDIKSPDLLKVVETGKE